MRNRRTKKNRLNIWQLNSDLMTTLAVILCLTIVPLILYLRNMEEEEPVQEDIIAEDYLHGIDDLGFGFDLDPEEDEPEEPNSPNATGGGSEKGGTGGDEEGGPGGDEDSGRGEGDGGEYEFDYEDPTPGGGGGIGPGMYPDEGIKSAVFVVMIDAETERTIKQEGVEFELYGDDNKLEILNTYYPVKVTYRKYETTKDGVFYLPEKVWHGKYYMHELTEPEGYDAAPNQEFVIDQLYDWPEPYIVRMPLTPAKNIIRVQMNDSSTGAGISGGTFKVIAATDILTQDGTLRYKEGEVVDTIVCDENGYGESIELYLGEYVVRQAVIPEYYESVQEDVEADVNKKTGVLPAIHETSSGKTTVTFTLTDELYTTTGIAGAKFTVTNSKTGTSREIETDAVGTAVLTDMEKNTTYTVRQTAAVDGYCQVDEQYSFTVAGDGRIDGETCQTVTMRNRLIRLQVNLVEALIGRGISGETLILRDETGAEVSRWTTSGTARMFTGLEPGNYEVAIGEETYPVTVKDVKGIQECNISRMTTKSIIAIAGAGGLAVLLAGLLISVLMKKKRQTPRRHRRRR